MLRRKTIIVLVITLMVTVMVAGFSFVYIRQIVRLRLENANTTAEKLVRQLVFTAENDVPDFTSTSINTDDPVAMRSALVEYLQTDAFLNNLLQSQTDWPFIYDATIVDTNGKALLHTNIDRVDKVIPPRPPFDQLLRTPFDDQLRIVLTQTEVYDVSYPLYLRSVKVTDSKSVTANAAAGKAASGTVGGSEQPFGMIRIGVKSSFLKNEIYGRLVRACYYSITAIFVSILLAAGISNLALGPLKQISRNLDSVSAGTGDSYSDDDTGHDEYGLVSLKIANLGRQIRDSREIFSALKDNVDQLMSKLQDGLMLFSRDSRVVLVSAPVEAFLGRPRAELLGRTVQEVFDRKSLLGGALLDAFERRRPLSQREIVASDGKRVRVSLDFVQEKNSQIGALLIMRDTESVRRIGDEIEMSRRLSASGRLTRGVAHEVKNPINAIVLHLQLLQNKLAKEEPDTRRHVDIIDSEIHRLDRVVQTLVDFTRPRDLHLEEIDLRRLLDDVAQLAAPDTEQKGVTVQRQRATEPLLVKVDLDLMKQALLNVVINGMQAMHHGGTLTISARREGAVVIAEVQDQGAGIPRDLHEKIFELYFTTRKGGSGIGLAQAYQILQWHYGSLDFESVEGSGTTFRFHIPSSRPEVASGQDIAADVAAS
jgi:signal transduction histidine kinase